MVSAIARFPIWIAHTTASATTAAANAHRTAAFRREIEKYPATP
jgi:hypothetical protein